MAEFKIHDIDSAPEGAKPLLKSSKEGIGMIPNLHGVMAQSPQVLEGYQRLHGMFADTSFTATERNVVWLTINVRHRCHYCVPAHTAIAKGDGVDDAVIQALRDGRSLDDPKLEALRVFTLQVVDKRGEVSDGEIRTFLDAGFTQRQVLEVVLGVAQKVMSNYINHIADTPVDEPFQNFDWTPKAGAAAAE